MHYSGDRVEELISLVSQPSRYLGGEINAVIKDLSRVNLKVCLAFPDVYEVGMSHLGLQILYHLLNERRDMAAERVYAPGLDMEKVMREKGKKLTSLETALPVGNFDVVGFSLQYELSYTNILNMLDLAGIPLYASQRVEPYPLIIGGGPCAFNPEPLADFFDAFLIGDGEEALLEVCDCIINAKQDKVSKIDLLHALSQIEGVYIPSFFKVVYRKNRMVEGVIPLKDGYERVKKRWVTSLDATPYIRTPIVPYKKIIHDRLNLEIARGCTRGCRFCQAGIIYRPVREMSLDKLEELADAALESSGYSELSLFSLSTGDYGCIVELLNTLMGRYAARKIAMSFPSLRSETLTPDLIAEIKKVRKTGFTIAPEAGTQRLRDIINKGITEDEILETVHNVFDAGWNTIKLYFMVGLPCESDEDVRGIVDLSRRVLSLAKRGRRRGQVTVSVSTFVPKSHTPFQWEPQIGLEAMGDKQEFLKKEIRRLRLTFKWQNIWMSYLEGIFARGDRRLSGVIEKAFQLGCRFDGWSEHLSYDGWKEALRTVDDTCYTTRKRSRDEVFPWDHIESGVDRDFLWAEYQRGLKAIVSPGCRIGGCTNCGICCGKKRPLNIHTQSEKRLSENDAKEMILRNNADCQTTSTRDSGYHRVRMQFSKLGKGRFLSHLELLALFSRALRRAKVPMRFSEGFHPLPRIVLGPALAVGIESRSEYMDLEIQGAVDCCELKRRLNREVPEWLSVLVSKEIPLKFPSISDSIVNIKYLFCLHGFRQDYFLGSEDVGKRPRAFTTNDTNYLEIKRKSGSSRIDLNQWVEMVQLHDESAVEVIVKMSGGRTVGPYEVLRALLKLKAVEKEKVFVIKTGEQFRIGPFSNSSTTELCMLR
jgi:radical SAM family uncharacterized protein/radical SAM-linked protein